MPEPTPDLIGFPYFVRHHVAIWLEQTYGIEQVPVLHEQARSLRSKCHDDESIAGGFEDAMVDDDSDADDPEYEFGMKDESEADENDFAQSSASMGDCTDSTGEDISNSSSTLDSRSSSETDINDLEYAVLSEQDLQDLQAEVDDLANLTSPVSDDMSPEQWEDIQDEDDPTGDWDLLHHLGTNNMRHLKSLTVSVLAENLEIYIILLDQLLEALPSEHLRYLKTLRIWHTTYVTATNFLWKPPGAFIYNEDEEPTFRFVDNIHRRVCQVYQLRPSLQQISLTARIPWYLDDETPVSRWLPLASAGHRQHVAIWLKHTHGVKQVKTLHERAQFLRRECEDDESIVDEHEDAVLDDVSNQDDPEYMLGEIEQYEDIEEGHIHSRPQDDESIVDEHEDAALDDVSNQDDPEYMLGEIEQYDEIEDGYIHSRLRLYYMNRSGKDAESSYRMSDSQDTSESDADSEELEYAPLSEQNLQDLRAEVDELADSSEHFSGDFSFERRKAALETSWTDYVIRQREVVDELLEELDAIIGSIQKGNVGRHLRGSAHRLSQENHGQTGKRKRFDPLASRNLEPIMIEDARMKLLKKWKRGMPLPELLADGTAVMGEFVHDGSGVITRSTPRAAPPSSPANDSSNDLPSNQTKQPLAGSSRPSPSSSGLNGTPSSFVFPGIWHGLLPAAAAAFDFFLPQGGIPSTFSAYDLSLPFGGFSTSHPSSFAPTSFNNLPAFASTSSTNLPAFNQPPVYSNPPLEIGPTHLEPYPFYIPTPEEWKALVGDVDNPDIF
ncbi:hypothetical protein BKA62DRAFT_785392 [Auriculariales sp. MPI-PUGE-AT-0066]|nr:hypothetical protein BKA62DRAFT_785392 [Auriculariales sp. MPI-PUGE-AT-0066]